MGLGEDETLVLELVPEDDVLLLEVMVTLDEWPVELDRVSWEFLGSSSGLVGTFRSLSDDDLEAEDLLVDSLEGDDIVLIKRPKIPFNGCRQVQFQGKGEKMLPKKQKNYCWQIEQGVRGGQCKARMIAW